jgi:predicted ATPase/DNA-binding winged helix-turn-helix (wHTH) protein
MRDKPFVDIAFVFGPFRLVPSQQVLLNGDRPVKLGGRALDLLHLLVRRAGEEISKDDLIAFAWPKVHVDEHNLKVHISSLRRALGDTLQPATYLATVVGHGYQFVGKVHTERIGILNLPDGEAVEWRLPDASPLIGRQRDVDGVARALDFARLVTVVGPGGVGKTSLAIAVAHARRHAFPDGIHFADLATINDPTLIPHVLAKCLGVRGSGTDVTSIVADYLQDRRVLLIMDNCEHVLAAAATIAGRLVDAKMRGCVLATSREPLGLSSENIQLLEPLAYPRKGDVQTAGDALSYPSIELFAQRAIDGSDYQLVDSDVPVIAALCAALDGLPLAIEIAVAKLNEFTPNELLESVCRGLGNIPNGRHDAHSRHRTLWATLDWSYQLLSANEANTFRLLSVFAGAFDLSDVAYMVRLLDFEPYQTTVTLGGLVSKSLLTAEINGDAVCYRLLESARQYAGEALLQDPIAWRAQQHHAHLVLSVFEQSVVEWEWIESSVWRKRYESRVGDLRKALDWCFSAKGDPSLGVDLAIAALRFWNEQSSIFEQLFQVGRALDRCAAIAGSELRQARLAESRGYAMTLARKPRFETDAAWSTALDFAKRSGDTGRLLSVMFGKAVFLIFSGRHVECIKLLDRFMALAAEAGDRGSLHDGERLAAQANLQLGNLVPVRDALERLADDLANGVVPSRITRYQKERYVGTHTALAFSTWLIGRRVRGLAMAEELVQNLRSGDQLRGQSNVLALVALPLALWSGQIPLLNRYLAILAKNLERENIELYEPAHRFYSAFVRYSEGENPAIDVMQSAIKDLIADEILMRTPMYQGVLAEALLDLGRAREADQALKLALDLQLQTQENWYLPELLRIKARILVRLGERGDAIQVIAEAKKRAELVGARSFEARILVDMVQIAEADQDHNAASALRRALADMADEDDARWEDTAEHPEPLRRMAASAPPEIWPVGISSDGSGVMPVNNSTETWLDPPDDARRSRHTRRAPPSSAPKRISSFPRQT